MLHSAGALLRPALLAIASVSAAIVMMAIPSKAELLYFTDFEDPPFTAGLDTWAGTDGWLANSLNHGVHGIDNDKYLGNDQTAFLGGFQTPESPLVVVVKPLNHDPVANNTDRILFDTLVAIHEPTPETSLGDSFWFIIYNIEGELLAGLRLSNELLTYGIWRYDGVNEFDTGLGFLYGQHHLFCIEVDFQNNRWRADIDGLPLFANAPFTARPVTRDLGSFSYEWQLTSNDVNEHGDNWMQVVDTVIWAVPPGEKNFTIDQVAFDSSGQPQIEFTGEPGWTYGVQYTGDLITWFQDLPGSTFSGLAEKTQILYSDPSFRLATRRWYRVVRSVTP